MSDRNTALLLPGHVDPAELARTLLRAPGVSAADFQGDEALRVGHGRFNDVAYTHVALRLFEVGGLLLIDQQDLPGADELETWLGMNLSGSHHHALYLHYDDERGVGGHALFEDGLLKSRDAVDGRWDRPLRRSADGHQVIKNIDSSDWVWPHVADAVALGANALFGEGVRTDDDIQKLIDAANAQVAFLPSDDTEPVKPAPQPEKRVRKRDKLKGMFKRLSGQG